MTMIKSDLAILETLNGLAKHHLALGVVVTMATPLRLLKPFLTSTGGLYLNAFEDAMEKHYPEFHGDYIIDHIDEIQRRETLYSVGDMISALNEKRAKVWELVANHPHIEG